MNPSTWIECWKSTSEEALIAAERNILASIWESLEEKFVTVLDGTMKLRTIALNTDSKATPIVLLHGVGGGVGLWVLNLEALSRNRPVYAFDVLGSGRSSRPSFSTDAKLAELEIVLSVEDWRREMKLEKFILLGHSLGAFISTSYAIRYADRVSHLILADPWGFLERPENARLKPVPFWLRLFRPLIVRLNPLAFLRAAGPWGPAMVTWSRPEFVKKFEGLCERGVVSQYVYHCNAQKPSGEAVCFNMSIPDRWAKLPMVNRVTELPHSMPITFINGRESFFDSSIAGQEVKRLRKDSYVDVKVMEGCGHLVFAEDADQFNELVNEACQQVENLINSEQLLTSVYCDDHINKA